MSFFVSHKVYRRKLRKVKEPDAVFDVSFSLFCGSEAVCVVKSGQFLELS